LTNVIDICYSVLCNVHFELIVLFAFHSCPLYAAEIRGAPDPAGYPVNLVDPAAGSGRIQCIWIQFGSGSGRI